ncbi:MAG: hypothetical protein LBV72_14595 [Tannerella sp.]|jgi:hypothetical protein|nr:hypothetical protein [Tannerella sp.]
MKKIVFVMLIAALGITTVSAQFEKGTKTLSGNLTGLGLEFNKQTDGGGLDDQISFGIQAKGNYFVANKFAMMAALGFNYGKIHLDMYGGDNDDTYSSNTFSFEIGPRYYFWNCMYGSVSYLGSKAKRFDYQNWAKIGVGATMYINDNVFFEPELYFKQGLGDSDIYSTLGLSIGVGVKF